MPEIPEEVRKFLEDLETSLKASKEALEKAEWYIKIGREMGFDVSEQIKRQEELKKQIERIEEVRKRYLGK